MSKPFAAHEVDVAIFDGETAFRDLLCDHFTRERAGYRVIRHGNPEDSLWENPEAPKPNLILLDCGLTDTPVSRFIYLLKIVNPGVSILIMARENTLSSLDLSEALKCGARGCVMKSDSLSEWTSAIDTVARGGQYISPGAQDLLNCPYGQILRTLSERQREVLRLIAQGYSTKEISTELNLSIKTAEHHRLRLMKKLSLHDSVSVVRFALHSGLVRLTPVVPKQPVPGFS